MNKRVSPTGSYSIEVPSKSHEDVDGRVTSYWVEGDEHCLQLSSYARTEGEPIPAGARLAERLARERRSSTRSADVRVEGADCAAAIFVEGEIEWVYFYAVWPYLTIFATLSGVPGSLLVGDDWALNSLRSISRATDLGTRSVGSST